MTEEQRQRIHDIEYSCDSREELAERIVGLEDELATWERLTAGIELPQSPITQFEPKDLERENAKLREDLEDQEGYDKMLRDRLRQQTELCVKAESENAKLQERVAELEELLPDSGRWYRAETVEAYVAEIAKLRELAQAAWRCIHTGASCSDCRLIAGGCTLQTAMRELGMEPDR